MPFQRFNVGSAKAFRKKKGRAFAELLGYLYSWGYNAYGDLGLGDAGNYSHRSSPNQVGSLTTWLTIAGGYQNCAAIKTDGTLWVWGKGSYGELGLGNTANRSSPVQVGALTTWSKVAVGHIMLFAITTSGALYVTGYNPQGQLGLNDTANRSSPVQVGALTNWAQIISNDMTHAIKTDGTLWAWGLDVIGGGISGLGNTINYSSPKQVGALTNWAQLSGSKYMTFAVKTDGTLWAWGYNSSFGALGLGDTINRSSPVQIGALTNWSSSIGVRLSGLAITTSGALYAWGRNDAGECGLGNTTMYSSPVQVGALTTWSKGASISRTGNNNTTLLIKTNGTLWGWGSNGYGQLGLNNTNTYSSPVQIGALTTWTSVSTSLSSSFAVLS